jgi:hypothetical protein
VTIGEVGTNKAARKELVELAEAAGAENFVIVVEHKISGEEDEESETALKPEQRAAITYDETVRETYDVSVYADKGDEKLEKLEFDDPAKEAKLPISLPYKVNYAAGETPDYVLVKHIKENGDKEPMTEGRVYYIVKGHAAFETSHLSVFSVTYDMSFEAGEVAYTEGNSIGNGISNQPSPGPDTSDGDMSVAGGSGGGCAVGGLGIAGMGALLAFALTRKRRDG